MYDGLGVTPETEPLIQNQESDVSQPALGYGSTDRHRSAQEALGTPDQVMTKPDSPSASQPKSHPETRTERVIRPRFALKALCCLSKTTTHIAADVIVAVPYATTTIAAVANSQSSMTHSEATATATVLTLASLLGNVPLTVTALREVPTKLEGYLAGFRQAGTGYQIAAVAMVGASLVLSFGAALPFYYATTTAAGAALGFIGIESAALITFIQATAATYTSMSAVGFNFPSITGYTMGMLNKFVTSTGYLTNDDHRFGLELKSFLTSGLSQSNLQNTESLEKLLTMTDNPDSFITEILKTTKYTVGEYGTLSAALKGIVWDDTKENAENYKNIAKMAVVGFTAAMLYQTTSGEVVKLFTDTFNLLEASPAATALGYIVNLAEAAFCASYGAEGLDAFLASIKEESGEWKSPGELLKACLPILVTAATLGPIALQTGGENGVVGALTDWKSVLAMVNAFLINFLGIEEITTMVKKYCHCTLQVSEASTLKSTLQVQKEAVEKKLKEIFADLPFHPNRADYLEQALPQLRTLLECAIHTSKRLDGLMPAQSRNTGTGFSPATRTSPVTPASVDPSCLEYAGLLY